MSVVGAMILADLEAGRAHLTSDGYRVTLTRGAETGRLVLNVKPPRGFGMAGYAMSAEDASERAIRWIAEDQQAGADA